MRHRTPNRRCEPVVVLYGISYTVSSNRRGVTAAQPPFRSAAAEPPLWYAAAELRRVGIADAFQSGGCATALLNFTESRTPSTRRRSRAAAPCGASRSVAARRA